MSRDLFDEVQQAMSERAPKVQRPGRVGIKYLSLRHREEQLEAARDDAETQLEQSRVDLPDTEEIVRYVADFREFLKDGRSPSARRSSATSWRASRWWETRSR